jgi:Carboxypeptidase regulatory-like domain
MKRFVSSWAFCLFVLLGLVLPASAQYRAGLQGVVLDTSGATVEGATLTLTNNETNHTEQTTSLSGGVYTFSSLAPGTYTLTVEKPGFKKQTLQNVGIQGEQIQALNVTIEVGEISATVTVNASEAAPIDTETGQLSMTLNANDVQSLPSFARDPFKLLLLAPGTFGDNAINNGGNSQNVPGSAGPGGTGATTSIFQTENQAQVFADGQRNEANSFQVDGVSVNSLDWGGASIITPNEESVQEVRITSNSYDATLGHGSAAQVEVVSKSGTNSLHGSLFIKMDRPGLDAYQGYNGPSGPAADQRVSNRFNQFGGSAGGPIIKNHLFAFFSYETLRNKSVVPGTAWVETPQFLTLAPTGSIASKLLSYPGEGAAVAKVLPVTCAQANMPATNCVAAGTGLNIGTPLTTPLGTSDPTYGMPGTPFGVGSGLGTTPDIEFVQTINPTTITSTQYNGRVDYQVTNHDLVAWTIYWVPDDTTDYNGQARPANLWHSDRLNYSDTLLWDHTFGPTLINEARFNVSRWYFNELESNPQEPFGLPQDSITGYQLSNQVVFGAPGPGIFYKTGYNIRDVATKVLSQMSLKFGVDIYKEQNTQTQSSGARPTYNFNDVWDLLNDAPVQESGQFNPTTGIPTSLTSYIRDNDDALFVQDDWKLKPNLTVNLGLRWEYFGPFHEKYNHLATTVLGPPPNQLTDLSLRLGGNLYQASKHNFGPQLGFAWSPSLFQNKLVFRGGFGIGYNRTEDAVPLGVLSDVSPLFADFTLFGPDIVYQVPSNPKQFAPYPANPNAVLTFNPVTNLPVSGAPIQLTAFPSYLTSPYTYRYSFEEQYDLGHNTVATVGYQGSVSHHLLRWIFQGQILFEPQNPRVNNVRLFDNDVNGNYNGLLLELQKHFSHGFELDAQYNYSHSHDDASTDYYFDDWPFTHQGGYGPSDYDATDALKLWGVYSPKLFADSPSWVEKVFGLWTFSGIYTFHTGFPFTPFYNVEVTGEPDGNTCSLIFDDSGYCTVRPAGYLGGALSDHSNHQLEQQLGDFPNGPTAYFTPPALTVNGIPPFPGVGRNFLRGPRYSDLDFTMSKGFGLPAAPVLGENARLEIRLNFYNLLNEVNLGPIGNQYIGTILLNAMTGVQTNPTPANGQAARTFDQSGFGLAGRVIEAQARFSF